MDQLTFSQALTSSGIIFHGWLPSKDSNLEREIQNLLCYHYTKGQLADAGEINSRIGRGVNLRVRSVAEVPADGWQ